MRSTWRRLGGRLGIGTVTLGLLVMFLGWNGAASHDRVPAQFPYLMSGGLVGLALVVLGSALIVVDVSRRNRAALEARIDELRRSLDRLATAAASAPVVPTAAPGGVGREADAAPLVVAGTSSYHRPSCRVLEGRGPMASMSRASAEHRGLAPCRVCRPVGDAPATAGHRRRRA